jgi:hypothetical protein
VLQQLIGEMGADEARASGDQNPPSAHAALR